MTNGVDLRLMRDDVGFIVNMLSNTLKRPLKMLVETKPVATSPNEWELSIEGADEAIVLEALRGWDIEVLASRPRTEPL